MLSYFSKILFILDKKKSYLALLVSLFLITSSLETLGIGLIAPFIAFATDSANIQKNDWSSYVFNFLGFSSDIQFISLFGLVIVGILCMKSFLGFNIQRYIFDFGFRQESELRSRLTHAYLKAPYTFHLSRNTAVSVETIIVGTQAFANGILMPILFCISNLLVIIFLTLLLLKTDVISTAMISVTLLAIVAVLYQFRDKLEEWGRQGSNANIEMIRIVNHSLGSFKETRVIGCESYFNKQMEEQAKIFKNTVASANAFSLLPRYILEPSIIAFLVAITIMYLLSDRGLANLTSTLGIFGMTSIRLIPACSNFIQTVGRIKNSNWALDKLYLDFKEIENINKPTLDSQAHSNTYTPQSNEFNAHPSPLLFEKNLVLDRIDYRYPSSAETALKDVSLTVPRGYAIGLMGRSGAGKTTLVDIVLGLLHPTGGDITVDGISVLNRWRDWQDLIGYIPQTIFLMDDTIERNVAFGVPEGQIDHQRLENAISAAQLSELMHELPEGIKTIVGEQGVRLSGGQRQRIGIARALYHEREVLVLDEATSALDNETEALVSASIQALSGEKTMIIIAHRLSTLEHCDRIYVMQDGSIVKSGSYKEIVLEASPDEFMQEEQVDSTP